MRYAEVDYDKLYKELKKQWNPYELRDAIIDEENGVSEKFDVWCYDNIWDIGSDESLIYDTEYGFDCQQIKEMRQESWYLLYMWGIVETEEIPK